MSRNHSDCLTLAVGGVIRFPVRKSVSSCLSHLLSSALFFCFWVLAPIRRIVRVSDHTQFVVLFVHAIHARLVHSCIQTLICFHSAIVRKKIIASVSFPSFNPRHGRSRHRPTNQSFRVCKVNLATLKVAMKVKD